MKKSVLIFVGIGLALALVLIGIFGVNPFVINQTVFVETINNNRKQKCYIHS